MRTRRRPLTLLLTGGAALGALAPAAGAAGLPTVLTQHARQPFAVKPATIDYTGDSSGTIGGTDGTSAFRRPGHLKWTTYDNREGVARGLVWLDDCRPSCAGGTFHHYAVRVHVFAPRNGHFTRLTLQYTYRGKAVTDRRRVGRHGMYYTYEIVG